MATRQMLARHCPAHLAETAILVVSELLISVVQHARRNRAAITPRLPVAEAVLRLEADDSDPNWPLPRQPDSLDESGSGLVLVGTLAAQRGTRDVPAGYRIS